MNKLHMNRLPVVIITMPILTSFMFLPTTSCEYELYEYKDVNVITYSILSNFTINVTGKWIPIIGLAINVREVRLEYGGKCHTIIIKNHEKIAEINEKHHLIMKNVTGYIRFLFPLFFPYFTPILIVHAQEVYVVTITI